MLWLHVIKLIVWIVVSSIFNILQKLYWKKTGTYSKMTGLTVNQGKTAHVLNIIWRYKFDLAMTTCGKGNFLALHKEFRSPDYVLQNNITLYSVSKEEAVFVEVNSGIDVTSSDVDAFTRHAQFKHAQNLIILPIQVFHEVAERVTEPTKPFIFINGTSRCGSSFLAQVFEQIGQFFTCDYPGYFDKLLEDKDQMTTAEFERCILHALTPACKDNLHKEAFIFKSISMA